MSGPLGRSCRARAGVSGWALPFLGRSRVHHRAGHGGLLDGLAGARAEVPPRAHACLSAAPPARCRPLRSARCGRAGPATRAPAPGIARRQRPRSAAAGHVRVGRRPLPRHRHERHGSDAEGWRPRARRSGGGQGHHEGIMAAVAIRLLHLLRHTPYTRHDGRVHARGGAVRRRTGATWTRCRCGGGRRACVRDDTGAGHRGPGRARPTRARPGLAPGGRGRVR